MYTCIGYIPFSTCDNIWLKRLVLHFCLHVVFPFCATFVEQVLFTMVTKTMQLHVMPRFVEAITLLVSFDL
jgi:hypothetical protein